MIYLEKIIEKIKKKVYEEDPVSGELREVEKIRFCLKDWKWDWIVTNEEYEALGKPKVGDTFGLTVFIRHQSSEL